MDHAIYTAMGAARAALDRQAVTADNLANASTPGFRAQIAAFRAVPVNGPSMATRTLVTESTPWSDDTMGAIESTGRNLDVAMPQNGWLAVQLPDGGEGYTKDGNIEVDSEGQLRVRGMPLLGDNGPIMVPPQAQLTIGPDGTITALGAGDEPKAVAQVGRLKMVNTTPDQLQRGDDGLFHQTDITAPALPTDTNMKLMPGMLEGSNVSSVKSMVDMIATARGFDMNMKVISAVDDDEKNANQLLSAG
ncbi:putative proximal rod protein [Enterobacter sp. DC4]|uniref:flagellar basal body rod protein FlgF n=1 Tax=Enterobacter sp. DC4 TaxID=1395580 RepID=UPI0003ED063C|nr:flagellar basal body rod protein FlgF [Enterobacter sp. DC4]EWG67286.1 putative proximal rod protein [Enterobacter sp. DC4]